MSGTQKCMGKTASLKKKPPMTMMNGKKSRRLRSCLQAGHDILQIGGAGQAEKITHAKQHESGGHYPEQYILDTGFHLDPQSILVTAHGDEKVQGKGRQFKGDKDGYQFNRADKHHQAKGAEKEKHVIFGPHRLVYILEVLAENKDNGQAETDHQLEEL